MSSSRRPRSPKVLAWWLVQLDAICLHKYTDEAATRQRGDRGPGSVTELRQAGRLA
jgi:hypothetical protein